MCCNKAICFYIFIYTLIRFILKHDFLMMDISKFKLLRPNLVALI